MYLFTEARRYFGPYIAMRPYLKWRPFQNRLSTFFSITILWKSKNKYEWDNAFHIELSWFVTKISFGFGAQEMPVTCVLCGIWWIVFHGHGYLVFNLFVSPWPMVCLSMNLTCDVWAITNTWDVSWLHNCSIACQTLLLGQASNSCLFGFQLIALKS